MKRNFATSPLLRLPPEIRNRIYSLALGPHRIVVRYIPHEHYYKTIKKQRFFDFQELLYVSGAQTEPEFTRQYLSSQVRELLAAA
ncbi:MAG: hypothetical protein L6R39_007506 [Caloplaca ligustica]|nr:MAG: hypothetical protein L6R39_007506 [Caloplaca ligustica]